MTEISHDLIEKALALCGKTMEDMKEIISCEMEHCEGVAEYDTFYDAVTESDFSYPKFYAFLLSPEFIEKYFIIYMPSKFDRAMMTGMFVVGKIAIAIYEYQPREVEGKTVPGNPNPLINLLEKI